MGWALATYVTGSRCTVGALPYGDDGAGLLGLEKAALEINAEYLIGCVCGLGMRELLSTCRKAAPQRFYRWYPRMGYLGGTRQDMHVRIQSNYDTYLARSTDPTDQAIINPSLQLHRSEVPSLGSIKHDRSNTGD